mgnify:CR=1 FL=1
MSLQDEIKADFLAIESDIPASFTYGSDVGPCATSSSGRDTDLIIGGKVVTLRQTLFARCELFTTPPVARAPITLTDAFGVSTELRIASVKPDAAAGHYALALVGLDEM